MNHYQVIPECYADTLLVEILGFKRPNHQLGIGNVLGLFKKKMKNRKAVGIIDDDKVKPRQLDQFKIKAEQDGIKWLTDDGHHSILILSPAFENWIFRNASQVGLDPADYGFHSSKIFREACKRQDASQNQELKQFLNTLKQKKAAGFERLRSWICQCGGIDPNDIIN